MISLRSPIPNTYMNNGNSCIVNQFFGESPNSSFYGPKGHTGIDFKTRGTHRYVKNVPEQTWDRRTRVSEKAIRGRIRLLAAHDGVMRLRLDPLKEQRGWGLYIDSENYRTLYWHIETPWRSLSGFRGVVKTIVELVRLFNGVKVKAQTPIAIAGDNGMSTGPHLHMALDIKENGTWKRVDPMPYFMDEDAVYQKYNSTEYWFQGKKITRQEAAIIKRNIKV